MTRILPFILICGSALASSAAWSQFVVGPCDSAQISAAKSALENAKKAVDGAIKDLDKNSAPTRAALQLWFGKPADGSYKKVRQTLVSSRVFMDGATFRCILNQPAKKSDVYAFVQPGKPFGIVLGSFFFNAAEVGMDSRPGTMIHEFSHFVLAGATLDRAYGQDQARTIALTNPAWAMENADNYEYFVESIRLN